MNSVRQAGRIRQGTLKASRTTVLKPEDVKAVAHDVLRHRLVLSYEAAAEQMTSDRIIDQILAAVPVP